MNKLKFEKGKHYIDLDGYNFCDLCLKHKSHSYGILGLHFQKKDLKKWNGHLYTKRGNFTKKAIKVWQIKSL